MNGEPMRTASKERNGTPAINYHLKSEVSITLRCQLCSTHYTALRIKNCLKSTSTIKEVTIKYTDDFRYKGKPSCTTAKLTPFTKMNWDTKGGPDKSMKNVLYVLRYAKRHVSG